MKATNDLSKAIRELTKELRRYNDSHEPPKISIREPAILFRSGHEDEEARAEARDALEELQRAASDQEAPAYKGIRSQGSRRRS